MLVGLPSSFLIPDSGENQTPTNTGYQSRFYRRPTAEIVRQAYLSPLKESNLATLAWW